MRNLYSIISVPTLYVCGDWSKIAPGWNTLSQKTGIPELLEAFSSVSILAADNVSEDSHSADQEERCLHNH